MPFRDSARVCSNVATEATSLSSDTADACADGRSASRAFPVVSYRDARGSILATTHHGGVDCPAVRIGDEALATAMLDRLLATPVPTPTAGPTDGTRSIGPPPLREPRPGDGPAFGGAARPAAGQEGEPDGRCEEIAVPVVRERGCPSTPVGDLRVGDLRAQARAPRAGARLGRAQREEQGVVRLGRPQDLGGEAGGGDGSGGSVGAGAADHGHPQRERRARRRTDHEAELGARGGQRHALHEQSTRRDVADEPGMTTPIELELTADAMPDSCEAAPLLCQRDFFEDLPLRSRSARTARSSRRFAASTFGNERSISPRASITAAATTSLVNHLLSAGTTNHGA